MANAQYEHNHTPTYARGAVCLLGDAAHVSSPVSTISILTGRHHLRIEPYDWLNSGWPPAYPKGGRMF